MIIVPIPGTKHTRYLDEIVGALNVVLTEDRLRRLGEALPLGVAAGARYHEQRMHTTSLWL